jgi:DNA-binding response OmpR family regulator
MSGKKIVIIDDDPEICDAMSEILSEYDYQVFTALDTKTGYQLLLEQRPDLLILDIMWKNLSSQKN